MRRPPVTALCASKELAHNGTRPTPPISGEFLFYVAARARALCAFEAPQEILKRVDKQRRGRNVVEVKYVS